jgi:hypothetical protein
VLTDDAIAAALERARVAVCTPLEQGCFALPFTPAQAEATAMPDGRQHIGWIVADSGRRSWDAWIHVETGEGRLRKR